KVQKSGNQALLDNQARKASQMVILDQLWGGRGWIPTFIRFRDQTAFTFENISINDVSYLHVISTLAHSNGVTLPSLYQRGGLLYAATTFLNNVLY
ncbi:hypothetical protein ACHAPA_006652, partial [Fusarium lateritium]